jgi:hypothetical protein
MYSEHEQGSSTVSPEIYGFEQLAQLTGNTMFLVVGSFFPALWLQLTIV